MGALVNFLTRAPQTSPKRVPQSAAAVAYSYDGRVGKPDARIYRHWSVRSEWIRGAINTRRTQVSTAEWDIVPFDKKRGQNGYSKRLQKRVRDLLLTPNPANDSFRTLIEPIVEDILVLDAGVIEKVRDLTGELRELWPVDGATIKVNANWDGDAREHRYFWYPDYKERARFLNEELVYMMANARTNSPVGLSALETLRMTIESELYGTEYNRRQVAGAAPDGVLDLGEGATDPDVQRYRAYFESEVAGRGAIGIVGGTKGAKWLPFRASNRDMQFLEWQIYLVRKIALVMGMTPQDLGVTFDINRSTAEMQVQISEDRGLRPLMSLIQDYITEEIVWDRSFGGPENNLAFRFTALNLKESTAKAAINEKALAGVPWRMFNEARVEEGREPVAAMEGKIIMATSQGAVDISDVPTMRELVEMQMKAKQQQQKPPADKEAGPSVHVDAPDLTPISDAVDRLVEMGMAGAATLAAAVKQEPPQVTIAEGAVQVKVETPITVEAAPVAPPRAVVRESQFQTDGNGRIVGKTETEREIERAD